MDIVIATNNPNKVREIKRIYETLCAEKNARCQALKFFTLKEKNLTCDVEENGSTFKENSLIKAKATASQTNLAVLADDSGICVSGRSLSGAHPESESPPSLKILPRNWASPASA